jgi:hypothetical protein
LLHNATTFEEKDRVKDFIEQTAMARGDSQMPNRLPKHPYGGKKFNRGPIGRLNITFGSRS